ncbi:CPBP family intramembrane metalloprotease [Spirosoma sp. BT702]|uniref:CPBP family intramembrane metalloprotease n=1 Tax=Spirosoma profusum TaxID=2771354 RepID=A0A927AQI2_9BACT|nr:CPBP family intramembrane metalloprotease [Spirosoma profusum]
MPNQQSLQSELKPVWNRLFAFNWKFGILLLFVLCIPRFLLVLQANSSANYGSIGLIMLISASCPFIFLTRYGRRKIGLTKPTRYSVLVLALLAGIIFSLLLYYLGISLYNHTESNWYVYIGKSYKIPASINESDKAVIFSIIALTSMVFSPIGEEFFFRGIVHSSFAQSFGTKAGSLVDSLAFALTHIAHFGLVFVNHQWLFLPIPALLWVVSMFLVSMLFFRFKTYSGSILGAVLCHSGFNLGMTYSIFYLL